MMPDLPQGFPLVSPDGAYWAYSDLWIGEIGKQPRQISDAPLEVLQWSSDSRSVLVTNKEDQLQYVAIAPDFELHLFSHYDARGSIGPWYFGEAIDD